MRLAKRIFCIETINSPRSHGCRNSLTVAETRDLAQSEKLLRYTKWYYERLTGKVEQKFIIHKI